MQKVRVLFFGAAADRAGTREVELPAGEGVTLGELWAVLSRRHPDLSPIRESLAFAINGEYASEEEPVRPGDEVAVLPPVSGG
ncbi:molybdopterin synthase sulfur carrier subunit [Rubrobacter xylanophilus]|uniref:Molybdopterin synthase sulfur carrier subunit n=1 Tax=Rubrobacter xylanophilus TaxID=49319 RepID=A0A510HN31_9ACTN|nr:molybdopterin converting factor subunit 1 [Rubrobacter xylanophilus]BBL79887.1 molybdopterin synthase sulfur carrier subunit [Rubrobacter xylanophilus]